MHWGISGRRAATILVGASLLAPGVAQAAHPLKIVALGDSYSAGNGASNDYYGPADCYRSENTWSRQYARSIGGGHAVTYINHACSGGVANDITEARSMGVTTVRVDVRGTVQKDDPAALASLKSKGQCQGHDDERYKVEAQSAAPSGLGFTFVTFKCWRYLLPQVDSVDESTDLVLLTMGGNDLHFKDIVEQCYVRRSLAGCRERVEGYGGGAGGGINAVSAVKGKLRAALTALRKKMRTDARIVLLSYPYLELYPHLTMYKLLGESYNLGERVRYLQDLGDQAQREVVDGLNASAGARAIFLDGTKKLFAGHEADGSTGGKNSSRWLVEPTDTSIPATWYHPNPTGHQQEATLVAKHGDFGVEAPTVKPSGAIDLAFVIDTTGSMGDAIDGVKQTARDLVDLVRRKSASARFALVDYRDYPERTGEPADYPSKLQQDFTTDADAIDAAIQRLSLGYGGDLEETVYSGINRAYDSTWRPGVRKLVVVLGDAPPLDPEPVSGLTADDIVKRSLAIDPVETQFVDVGGMATQSVEAIADGTNGGVRNAFAGDAAEAIGDSIEQSLDKPYAWVGGPYAGRTGASIAFDGSGSYGVGSNLTSYEWDFDGDGTYDQTTTTPLVSHAYPAAFSGVVALRVTDEHGMTGLASAEVAVSRDADGIDDGDDNCVNDFNPDQADADSDGIGDVCDPTTGIDLVGDASVVFRAAPYAPTPTPTPKPTAKPTPKPTVAPSVTPAPSLTPVPHATPAPLAEVAPLSVAFGGKHAIKRYGARGLKFACVASRPSVGSRCRVTVTAGKRSGGKQLGSAKATFTVKQPTRRNFTLKLSKRAWTTAQTKRFVRVRITVVDAKKAKLATTVRTYRMPKR